MELYRRPRSKTQVTAANSHYISYQSLKDSSHNPVSLSVPLYHHPITLGKHSLKVQLNIGNKGDKSNKKRKRFLSLTSSIQKNHTTLDHTRKKKPELHSEKKTISTQRRADEEESMPNRLIQTLRQYLESAQNSKNLSKERKDRSHHFKIQNNREQEPGTATPIDKLLMFQSEHSDNELSPTFSKINVDKIFQMKKTPSQKLEQLHLQKTAKKKLKIIKQSQSLSVNQFMKGCQ